MSEKDKIPLRGYSLILCQGFGISTMVISVSVSALTGFYITEDLYLSTLPYGGQFIAILFSVYIISRLMGKYGRRKIFLLAGVIGLMTTPLALLAIEYRNIYLLFLAHMSLGVFAGGVQLYRFAILDISPKSLHARAINLVMIGGIIAAFLGPFLARNTEWFARNVYEGGYIAIGAMIVIVSVLMIGIRFPKPQEQSSSKVSILSFLKNPVFIFAALSGGLGYGIMNGLMASASLEMDKHDFHFNMISQVIQWHVVLMYAPSLFNTYLINKLSIGGLFLLGVLAMVCSSITGIAGVEYFHFMLTMLFLGVGWNFLFVGSSYIIGKTFRGEQKFSAQGLNDSFIHFVSMIGALGSGFALSTLGWELIHVISILCMLGLVVFFAFIYRSHLKAITADEG